MKKLKAIFGAGGHAREVAVQMGEKDLFFFVDDIYANGDFLPISEFRPSDFEIMVAVANPFERKKILENLPAETKFFTFIHPTALLMDSNITIGEGSFIGANCILTTNIQIGKHAILNRGNQIGHDCRIGDFFSAMPSSVVGGNVSIGDGVYLGSCSNIKEKITISNWVTVGMNGAVVSNLTQEGTYVGVPAKKIIK